MMSHSVMTMIEKQIQGNKKAYWVLLDPDDFTDTEGITIATEAEKSGAHAILVGGSLINSNHLDTFVQGIKSNCKLPVILFPGDASQITKFADAILFLSLVSGRNPNNLIGEQVKGAPLIRGYGIEPLATAYMLIDGGVTTSVEFMSNTRPIPRDKGSIAAAHALAAQYMGMRLVYLEAGSGAQDSVPEKMIQTISHVVDIPIIVGGGIRNAETALSKIQAGADIIVTGNLIHQENGVDMMYKIGKTIRNFG